VKRFGFEIRSRTYCYTPILLLYGGGRRWCRTMSAHVPETRIKGERTEMCRSERIGRRVRGRRRRGYEKRLTRPRQVKAAVKSPA